MENLKFKYVCNREDINNYYLWWRNEVEICNKVTNPCSIRQVRYDVIITTKISKSFVMFLHLIIIKPTREYDWQRSIRVYVIIFVLLKPKNKIQLFQRLLISSIYHVKEKDKSYINLVICQKDSVVAF